ncbi:hypothetical protein [Teichococcus coralli]|uniref:hypothetical protein n=1 Tax=Teichococcus coralli TaxID=2545983 RepID=UPI00136BD91E|nr:hypothetical protein [Pseudoroseomonas coralli]
MKKRDTAEQIIGLLRQAEVELAQGRSVGEICRGLGRLRPATTADDRNMAG